MSNVSEEIAFAIAETMKELTEKYNLPVDEVQKLFEKKFREALALKSKWI